MSNKRTTPMAKPRRAYGMAQPRRAYGMALDSAVPNGMAKPRRAYGMAQPRRAYGISAMQHPNRHGFLRDTEPRRLTEDERVELEYTEMEKERNEFLRRLSYYKKLIH